MARFSGDPRLVQAIRDGVREMRQRHGASGCYDGHDLINWLDEHRNKELNEIYDHYNDCTDPEMTADQQIGRFLYRLGQKKFGERTSARHITKQRGHRDGFCQVSVWSITDQTALGNPEDDFASPDEREEFQDELRERAFHAIALRNLAGRMEDIP